MANVIKIVLLVAAVLLLMDMGQNGDGLTAQSLAESVHRFYLTLTGGS